MTVITIILTAVFLVALVAYMFPLAVVVGQSMEPTYHERDILLCRRVVFKNLHNYYSSEVYVFKAPYEDEEKYFVIKRVSYCISETRTKHLCMLGDNPSESYDSRMYGLVPSNNVVAKVLFRIKKRV